MAINFWAKWIGVTSCAIAMGGAMPTASGAFLEGKPVLARRLHQETPESHLFTPDQNAVVGPGTEFVSFGGFPMPPPGIPPIVDIDVSDTNIKITLIADVVPAWQESIVVRSFHEFIPDFATVTVNPETTWPGATLSNRIQYSGVEVFVIFALEGAHQGDIVSLDVTGRVPEPGCGLLAASCVATVAARRRTLGARK